MMKPETEALYHEANARDAEFQAALVALYGERRAGDMRYASNEHPPEIAAKAKAMQEASDRFREAVKRDREEVTK